MGVPGFFLWLWNKYNHTNFVFDKDNINSTLQEKYKLLYNIDNLLIDTNCLIHPKCFEILHNNDINDIDKLQSLMIDNIINYLNTIIYFVKPTKNIYIAIDGVAPLSKIKQQRARRYKSIKDNTLYDNIRKKHNKPIPFFWNNSAITPGTEFMESITNAILNYINNLKPKYNINIIFSSANTPSEGEHKLLQFIKNNKYKQSYVIYGLDADLLFLSLASQKDNIYLLREANQFDNKAKNLFNFVSIDVMKDCIYNEITSKIDENILPKVSDKKNIINDFIFICYFLGNDFIPKLPTIDIKNNNYGIDLIINAYIKTINYTQLNAFNKCNNIISINPIFLLSFLENLSYHENNYINNYKPKNKKPCYSNNPFDIEMYKIDNLNFIINDPIQFGLQPIDIVKYNYYKHYFFSNNTDFLLNICREYFKGLIWIANYYFDKCISWNWFYPYDHAPFISDLMNSIKDINFNNIKFELSKPITPFIQLLTVLPPQSKYLLPESYKYLVSNDKSPIIDIYPNDFKLDMLYKHKYWECIPLLPIIDINRIINATNDKQLTETETNRNKQIDEYII